MYFWKLPIPLRAYLAAHFVLLPAALAGAAGSRSWVVAPDPRMLGLLVAMSVIAGAWKFRLPVVPGMQSLVFTVVTLALLTQGISAAVLCAGVGALVTHLVQIEDGSFRLRRKGEALTRHLFNVCHCALVCALSGIAWDAAAGTAPSGTYGVICRLALFTTVYFLLNSWGLAEAIALERRRSAPQIWRENLLWTAPGFFVSAAASALLWFAYSAVGPLALLLLPAYYLIYRGYGAYIHALRQARELATKLESLYQREEEANRRKDEFLAMLAHELRNPLAAIGNAQYVLTQTGSDPESRTRNLQVIGRQTSHLKRLVDDLLDVSRITRGVVELRCEPVDLSALLRSALETIELQAAMRGHEVISHLPDQPLPANADPARVEQIILNLLTNAVKYTDPGGRIEVWLEVEGPSALLRVKDNGTGIDAELLPRIFELFVQADRSLARSQGGLGIGLTLVRALVEMHGGRVEARSEGPGKGSEFIVRLPLAADAAGALSGVPTPIADSRSATVVVVEDNVDTADTLAELLDLWGYHPLVATSGSEGLELARSASPDVVLLDIGLPEMDGYEIARRLRQESGNALRLIALTGYGRSEDRESAQEAGIDHHLVKPVNPEELRGVLRRVLGQSALQA